MIADTVDDDERILTILSFRVCVGSDYVKKLCFVSEVTIYIK